MHGYRIIKELSEQSEGRWRPSAGSIYPTLQQLEDEGLVTSAAGEGKRIFSLTEAGLCGGGGGRRKGRAAVADRPRLSRGERRSPAGPRREAGGSPAAAAAPPKPAAAPAEFRDALYQLNAAVAQVAQIGSAGDRGRDPGDPGGCPQVDIPAAGRGG